MRELFIQATYLAAAVLFILGLRGLSSPASARRGMIYASIGMFWAVVGTLLNAEIITFTWIIVAMVIGSLIGAAISIWMPMTAVPQRTAISHMFGALAATLVGVSEYYRHFHGVAAPGMDAVHMAALGFEVMFGSLTITGSFMAFGKLQGFIRSEPMTYKFQNFSNIALFFVVFALFVFLIFNPTAYTVFYSMIALGLLIGVLLVMPIGGADMPVVISLLNSYAGLASAATGFVLGNNVLIIAGSLDGSSGFLLSVLMSKAMNRSFRNVLFGAFGSADTAAASLKSASEKTVRSLTVEDAAVQLGYARSVIFIPGYGMAVAQAQHAVK
ncbi:MAG: NAD synthetase, partial [Deltaproteobacteria bacterium 21-66-5]